VFNDAEHEKYREAWNLLVEGCKGPERPPLEIRAWCDESETAGESDEFPQIDRRAKPEPMVRRMFRTFFLVLSVPGLKTQPPGP
jgi:hypothetical protein